jgi:8-oxo-dGTP diphosphatase
MANPAANPPLPYKLACLCDLRDEQGRILLLRRNKEPNLGLCSPIGGKLDMHTGESPAQCAQREILEEAGIQVPLERLHLMGLISETAFEGRGHWLLFYYRVLGPVSVPSQDIREGRLDWFYPSEVDSLPLPETDRRIIWPLVRKHESSTEDRLPGFFTVHIDCSGGGMTWTVDQSCPAPEHLRTETQTADRRNHL